jgi:hypothetical protein
MLAAIGCDGGVGVSRHRKRHGGSTENRRKERRNRRHLSAIMRRKAAKSEEAGGARKGAIESCSLENIWRNIGGWLKKEASASRRQRRRNIRRRRQNRRNIGINGEKRGIGAGGSVSMSNISRRLKSVWRRLRHLEMTEHETIGGYLKNRRCRGEIGGISGVSAK